jgi:two-component system, OmpR family, phosphate regulon sensor histidine kinase PhoR
LGIILITNKSFIVADIRSIADSVGDLLVRDAGWVLLVSGILLGFVAGLILMRLKVRSINKTQSSLVSNTVDVILDEKSKSEAILNDLDVGILAYGSDGMLINYNPAYCKIMRTETPPQTFRSFLAQYGSENGLQASVMLKTTSASAIYFEVDRVIRIRIKETSLDKSIRTARIIVIQDITEHENEDKRRKEFVANVSHELKTPLTTIKTYSESLIEWGLKEKNKQSISKDIRKIHDDAIRMTTLVENLLLLSSIDSKEMRPHMDLYDLQPIVRSIVDRMQIQADEKEIKISCYLLGTLPMAFMNHGSFEQIVINIIGNAIKYTGEKGKISVYMRTLSDDIYIKISDTGYGIEKEHLQHIFNRFYRVDMTGSRMYGGTGLGLSISKELAELHGGDISVSSVLGKGSDFVVRIPIAEKVFLDAIAYNSKNNERNDILYRMASEFLMKTAKKIGVKAASLSELPTEKADLLIQKALDANEL